MMRNFISLLICAGISIGSYSCSFIGNCVEGEGKIVEENIKLESFSEIELYGSSKVFVKQGKIQSVTIKAQSNLIDLLNREVSSNTWKIKFSKCVNAAEEIEIYITVPNIEEMEVLGSGEIIGQETIQCENLELEIKGSGEISLDVKATKLESSIAGSGDIKITGDANAHEISIKGSGDISAYDLETSDTDVEIKGSGNVKVNVNSSLYVEILGSGDVYYIGDVQNVSSDIKGSGNLSRK